MGKGKGIRTGLRGILVAALALFLGLQVGFAYQPRAAAQMLGANEALIEICDGTGLHMIVIDLATGETRRATSEGGKSAPQCPFCITGLGIPALNDPLPDFRPALLSARHALPVMRLSPERAHDDSRPIRGAPVFL